ncbi:MAG: LacI family transcriptional regulator [Clostridia bacterium]|nr:LacI family transcriptional regulator [Clostridia bacterium]
MSKKAPTREDVAKRAGVSITIVSYVLNNNRYVKKEKRERVLKAVDELGYQANRFARALKGKKDKHIMLLTDRVSTEYYGELISDIEKSSKDLGYLVSISIISNTEAFINKIISWQIDGVIISSISFREDLIQKIVQARIPVILMKNRDYEQIKGAAMINTGLYDAMHISVKHLYDTGCRNIVYLDRISIRDHFSDIRDFRLRGYYEAMKDVGLEDKKHVITKCRTIEEMRDKLMKLMKAMPVDGIVGRNDYVAEVAMNELVRKGYRVPEDVSIIGVNNSSYAKISIPTLSSLKMKREEIAQEAIDIIENISNGGEIPEEKLFVPELVIRESTRGKKESL